MVRRMHIVLGLTIEPGASFTEQVLSQEGAEGLSLSGLSLEKSALSYKSLQDDVKLTVISER
jgi:hypothetical protein